MLIPGYLSQAVGDSSIMAWNKINDVINRWYFV